jgi:hypothetical protein
LVTNTHHLEYYSSVSLIGCAYVRLCELTILIYVLTTRKNERGIARIDETCSWKRVSLRKHKRTNGN